MKNLFLCLALAGTSVCHAVEEVYSTNVGGYYTLTVAGNVFQYAVNQFDQNQPGGNLISKLCAGFPAASKVIYGPNNVTATKMPNASWQFDAPLERGVPFLVVANASGTASTVMAGTLESGIARELTFQPYQYELTSSGLPLSGEPLAPGGIGMPPARGMTIVMLNANGQGQSTMGLPNMTFLTPIEIPFGTAFEFIYNTTQTWKQELVIPPDSLQLEVLFNQ